MTKSVKESCAMQNSRLAGTTGSQIREGDDGGSAAQSSRGSSRDSGLQQTAMVDATMVVDRSAATTERSSARVEMVESRGGEGEGEDASGWGAVTTAREALEKAVEERYARLETLGIGASGGSLGVMAEGVWQEVCRKMEKGVAKLGWVHQGNVQQITGGYRSLQMGLKGTGWGAAEAAWAWIADRQAAGDSRIDGRVGRMNTGKGKEPIWNWEWQARARAGRGHTELTEDMI